MSDTRLYPVLLLAVLITGCTPPDRWAAFEPDWAAKLEAEARRSKASAEEFRPQAEQPPALDFPAEGDIRLTVEQATLMALRNNRELSVRLFDPLVARTFADVERSIYDPEVFAEATYGEFEASETSRATEEQFAVVGQERRYAAGVRQRLPTGTDVELEATEGRSFSNRTPDQHEARLGLTVTQALLQGFGPTVNLAAIRQADLDLVASRYELRGFIEALVAEVETTYWRYAFAREAIAIFEQSLELAQRQENEAAQRIEVGVLAPTEGAAARAEVALREQDLIDARSELDTQRLRLMRLVNVEPDAHAERPLIAASEPAPPEAAIDDLAERVRVAQRYRPDLSEARLRLDQNRLETIVTRNGLLPRLDLFATVGKSGYAESFREALTAARDEESYDLAAGIEFRHFLGNRAAEARDLAARASREQSAAAVANLEQLVALDVRLAATQVERARQQIGASAATRALREEALRAEEERFRVGASTSLLVAQAQRDLVASRIDELEATIGHRVALIELHRAEGTLLERRGIAAIAEEPAGASR